MAKQRGKAPDLNYLLELIERDQLSAVIVGHLLVESLMIQFLEAQPGETIDAILRYHFPLKVDRCIAGGLLRPAYGAFLKSLNEQRNNFAHQLGYDLCFEEAFVLAGEAAAAGVDFSDDEIHTNEAAPRKHYGTHAILVEILQNVAQDIAFFLMDHGLEYPFA